MRAIAVHQTDSPTAQATFNAYRTGGNGAHFLIDKPGTVYQTASLQAVCFHVGSAHQVKVPGGLQGGLHGRGSTPIARVGLVCPDRGD